MKQKGTRKREGYNGISCVEKRWVFLQPRLEANEIPWLRTAMDWLKLGGSWPWPSSILAPWHPFSLSLISLVCFSSVLVGYLSLCSKFSLLFLSCPRFSMEGKAWVEEGEEESLSLPPFLLSIWWGPTRHHHSWKLVIAIICLLAPLECQGLPIIRF